MFLVMPTLPDEYTSNTYVALVFIDRAIANWLCDVHQAMLSETAPYPATKITPHARCYQYWFPVGVYAPSYDEPLYRDSEEVCTKKSYMAIADDVPRNPFCYAGRTYADRGSQLTKLIVDHDEHCGVVFNIHTEAPTEEDHTDVVETYRLLWPTVELIAQGKHPCSQ